LGGMNKKSRVIYCFIYFSNWISEKFNAKCITISGVSSEGEYTICIFLQPTLVILPIPACMSQSFES
jgi:hypothetical protein